MIYDCFSFFNELDLLEIRLNVLKDVVDKFVLVEAGETHSGKTKPLYFKENESRFAAFRDRIIYVCIERFPDVCTTDWARENYQRNAIADGLKGAKDDDVVLVSDLDEIPRPEKIVEFAGRPGVKVFDQTYYAFYLNYRNVRQQCYYLADGNLTNAELIDALEAEAKSRASGEGYRGFGEERHGIGFGA